jgi:hypothetical protein
VVCFHSVGLGCSWTFTVIISSWMISWTPPYLFLCIYHLPKWHMMSNFLYSFINFLYSP